MAKLPTGYHIVLNIEIGQIGLHSDDSSHGGTWGYDTIERVRPYADRSISTLLIGFSVGAAAMFAGGWGILAGLGIWAIFGYITYNPRYFVKVTLSDGYELWLNVKDRAEAEALSKKIIAAMQNISPSH